MNYKKLLKPIITVIIWSWPCIMLGGMQPIPQGSFVIPMDNVNQAIVPAGQAPFNLKAYGLVNMFLQNGIPVRWAIKSSKGINDIDFSATVERIAPTAGLGSLVDFRGGPFIVPDTILPCGLSTRQIIQSFGNNVVVYRLTSANMIDIKYTITHHPKIAVFNNGGNELIHAKILDAAGIKDYVIMDAADIGNLKDCFTFASEPHAEESEVSLDVIAGVKEFVMNGGNFLAQCHAIDTYENRGFFHTTSGISTINANITHSYLYADNLYCQINGTLQENEGGSVSNWTLQSGSSWKANTIKTISYRGGDTVVAMEAHLAGANMVGGNVYYLGGHDYAKAGKGSTIPDLTTLARVNALRMYLNAAFVPSHNSNGAWANAGPADQSVGCSDSVVLGCTQTGPLGATFLWTPATGLSCTTCPNPIARPTVTTTYTVQVTNGCIATDTVRVVVGPKPIAKYTNTTVCRGAATSFTDQSTGTSFWNWNFGDPDSGENNVSSLQHPTHVFSKAGTFTVTLISGTSVNCTDTLVSIVVVNSVPLLTVNRPMICKGQTTTLNVAGATSYLWDTGSTSNVLSVSPSATTTYTVTGTTSGCSSSINVTVKVAPAIVPSVTAGAVTCNGNNDGTASVNLSGGIAPFTYQWNTSPVQTAAQVTGLQKGSYSVTVIDSLGCQVVVPVTITEPSAMILNTKATNVSCPNRQDGAVEVMVQGGNAPYGYEWNTNPKKYTSSLNTLSSGSYQVTVTDAKACSTTTLVQVSEPVSPVMKLSSIDVKCHGDRDGEASISIQGGNMGYSFVWDSNPSQTGSIASSLPKGIYKVTVQDPQGCLYYDSIAIGEPRPIKLGLTSVIPSCIQLGSATVIPSGGTGAYSFEWSTNPSQNSATAINVSPGHYKVVVADSNGCIKDTSIILPAPVDPIADFGHDKICLGSSSTHFFDRSGIPVSSGGIASMTWNFGDHRGGVQNTATGQSPSHLYDQSGTFNVTLTVVTLQGCADTIVKLVEVYPLPIVKFSGGGEGCDKICASLKDESSVAQGNIHSWLWNFGDGQSSTEQNPTYCYNKEGSYDITLKVITDHGCEATLKDEGSIKVHANPKVDLGPTLKACYEGENRPLTMLDAGEGTKYIWHHSGETTRYVTVQAVGTYHVTVGNAWNCEATGTVEIKQICPPSLFVSNAFSPNSDGTNDMYTVYSNHVGKYQMLIFNRWGEIIFESRDKNHFWDGIYRDEPMPIGVYAWIITYEGDTEEYRGPYIKEGSVTVVR